ncbi:MAG: N-acetylmuramoyl-L-alanine amidase [Terriglobales bacterium]
MNNAGLELLREETAPVPACATPSPTDSMGHEALQALLAFAALHDQVRKRRAKQANDSDCSSAEDDWQVEHFLLDEVLQLVAERALAITGADGAAIAWAEGDAIVCRASAGTIAPDAGIRLDPNSGFSGECLVSGRIVRCDDADTDPRVNVQACQRLGVRSMLAVPISAKENVIGLLEAFSNEPHGFNDSDVRSLCLLAELILSAMKPEEEDRLREISRRIVPPIAVEPVPIPVAASSLEIVLPEAAELPAEGSSHSAEAANSAESAELVSPEDSKSSDIAVTEHVLVEPERLKSPPPGLAVVAAVVLVAAALGAGVWWKLGHGRSANANASPTAPAAASIVAPTTIGKPVASAPAVVETVTQTDESNNDESDASPAAPEAAGVLPQVTGIRHWSSADSSTVVIDIQDQVQYEAHRLSHPERIYFDLHDTTLAATLTNRVIPVNDTLLERIRVAQPIAGVTRVVLETDSASDFSVSLEPNPYRLVVEVRKLGTKPRARAKIDLFAPAPSDQTAANQVGANQKPLDAIALSSKPNPPSPSAGAGNEKQPGASLTSATAPPHTAVSPQKLRIVLDAGHGGWDLGTVGRKGLLEKDLTLDIVERLGQLIENHLGAEVIYTRKDDSYLPLEKRAEIANLAQASLFVSVHANYSDYPSARGVETYYTNTYSSVKARTEEADEAAAAGLKTIDWTNVDIRERVHESRRVAISVQRALYATLSAKNPGLPNRGVKEAHYVVLTGTSMPAILAEVSFVSSPTDENNLESSTYRQQIAEALCTGIARYQASSRNVKMASTSAKPTGR